MEWTYDNLWRAREAVEALLTELRLETYLFAIEPRAEHCEIRIQYVAEDGWRDATLTVDDTSLLASRGDPLVRSNVLQTWREDLSDARRARGAEARAES